MQMQFRQTVIEVRLEGGELTISPQAYGLGRTIKVGVNGEVREISVGESYTFTLADADQVEPESVAAGMQS